ncbi:hypothetical protein [Reyranella sp.]|uniref:hypothetical protein n=1 Tax=Reyranella sp. TaxID=1929291 RepID=UPI003D11DFE4
MIAAPYVTFVTYARNDGYTPGYIQRVRRAMQCLAGQLDRAGVDAEIIITEWNPPPDRPHILEVVNLPKALKHVSIWGVIVGAEHHAGFAGAAERGFHAGEAANIGLRRARGRFVVPKSSDTFLSAQTIERIARRDLDVDTMYRVCRHDVTITDEHIWGLDDEALLAAFATLPSSINAMITQPAEWDIRDLHTNACGDFMLMSGAYWHYLRGYPRDPSVLVLDGDSLIMHAAAALGVRECRWPDDCRIYKPSHGNLANERVKQVWRRWQRWLDRILSEKVDAQAAYWARKSFNYPRREVRGVESVLGPSIERNFVVPATRWAHGTMPEQTQPANWGLAEVPLERRVLCRAEWDAALAFDGPGSAGLQGAASS